MRSLWALERAKERPKENKDQGDPKNKGIQRIQVSDKDNKQLQNYLEKHRDMF